MKKHLSERDLELELNEFRDRYTTLGRDELFVLWFTRAFLIENEAKAVEALCGGPNDKGIDAILIDESARIVFIVQGKYRHGIRRSNEHRADIIGFAQVAASISGDETTFRDFTNNMSPEVSHRLNEARKFIRRHGYAVHLYYVTTGKCSKALQDDADRSVANAKRAPGAPRDLSVAFRLIDGGRILRMLMDYLDGVAPPVPQLDLEIEPSGGAANILNRHDSKTNIEAWVFSMRADDVAEMFKRARTRLFARNIRGYLGDTDINDGIKTTLQREPENFWYYNNGITVVCDDANLDTREGRSVLRVTNPQVINGQQTTRTLAEANGKHNQASMLVKVIRIPRESTDHFERLVSQIVASTNWQNKISASDLRSNDRVQIQIDRELRKRNYLYLRKRMTKGEARKVVGNRALRIVRKEEFAQAVAASKMDPELVLSGKEILFEAPYYGQIFWTSNPNDYLSRYWLSRSVNYKARGKRERQYGRWLVLHHLWPYLQQICSSRARAEIFRHLCETDDEYLTPYYRAIDLVHQAVQTFYRQNRGAGQKALDAPAFFKRKGRHIQFKNYWQRSSLRPRFAKAWGRFADNVEAAGAE